MAHQRRCLWAASVLALAMCLPRSEVAAMLYLPPEPFSMWDTWLFQDGDEFHLFFLQSQPGSTWNTLGRAVSKDLVHWTPLPPIPTKGPKGAWDEQPTLTGMTVKIGRRYATFYGSAAHGQKIGLMWSDDLKTWEKHPGNPTLGIKGPHYGGGDWRDMCTFYDPREKVWHGYVCAQTAGGGGEPRIDDIADKTLVTWVTAANTTQRGGSVLTLNHGRGPGDLFDAIVFGERRPGCWMAGSEFFRRTDKDQSACKPETAGPDELVQMAIAYKKSRITVYRNGEVYASHDAGGQQVFGSGTAVVMGLRHVGAAKGSRFFAGTVEEARVYNVALDQAAVKGLKPGQMSDPKPVAMWTFEGGEAVDAMGTFPEAELRGGARIEGGRLHLDGVDGCLITPARPEGQKACIAHLTSNDLVAWDYLPPAFASADFVDMEVPDYFALGRRHYLLFSSGRSRKDTSGRRNASGTCYVMSESRDGPYRVPARPLLLGSGRGRFDNYVGRTIPFEGSRLLYQHTCGGPVSWGAPKLVRQHPDGTLWLQYWPGLAKLETRVLVKTDAIEGEAAGEPSLVLLPPEAADTMIAFEVDARQATRVGCAWRWDGAKGSAVTLEQEAGRVAIVALAAAGKSFVTALVDDIDGVKLADGPQHLRLIVRAHRVEVYLNDCWLFGVSLTGPPARGKIGLLVDGGKAAFRRLRIAELEPLRRPQAPGP